MASTNKTTNYELSQFVETDRPAWLTDYNGDMRKLDTALKAVSDVANGASGSISELADRMSTAEGNITTNTNDIDALEARADSLEAQAQSQAGTIANIQTEQTAQNLGIEAATELGYNLARPYDSASTYAVGDYVLFQNTLYKCVMAVPVGEAFNPTKWIAIKATDEISGSSSTLITELNDTNFNLNAQVTLAILNQQSITLNNFNVALQTPNTVKHVAVTIGKLKMLHFVLHITLDAVNIPANGVLTIQMNVDDPAIIGNVNKRICVTSPIRQESGNAYYQIKGPSDANPSLIVLNMYNTRATAYAPNHYTIPFDFVYNVD